MFGIPTRRLPLAVLMVLGLAGMLSWLQGQFDHGDVKKAIAIALSQKTPAGATVLDAISARAEGDPLCDGKVMSTLFGDVEVSCVTPKAPAVEYRFRVLLDGKKPPRAESPAAEALLRAGPPTNAAPAAPAPAPPRASP